MSDRPELTVEVLVDHWRRQGRKLTDAGVPLERVVASLREASLQAEEEWFNAVLDEAKERLAGIGTDGLAHGKGPRPADVSLTQQGIGP